MSEYQCPNCGNATYEGNTRSIRIRDTVYRYFVCMNDDCKMEFVELRVPDNA